MSSEEEMLREAKKLAWNERLLHENWKVRNEANIDLAYLCDSITNPKDQRLREFGTLFTKTVSDSNVHVQERALDALIAFLRVADADSASFAKEICDAIAAKCLNGRPKIVKKSQIAFLLWIELEAADVFLDAVENVVKKNVSKAVVSVVDVMFQALREFGSKIVPPERILKMLPELFEHRDQNVRASSKRLTLELCRWIGKEPVKSTLFEKMRDTMKNELEAELVNVRRNAWPSRKIRAEHGKELEATASKAVCSGPSQESLDYEGHHANGNFSSLEGASAVPKKTFIESDSTSAAGGLHGLAREDIARKSTPALLRYLGSTDWKVRLETIETINKKFQEAGKPVGPTGTYIKSTFLSSLDADFERDPLKSVKGLKYVYDQLTRLTRNPESRSMDYISKDPDWLISCLANKVPKTLDLNLAGTSSMSIRYVLNILLLLFLNKEVAHAVKESTLDGLITELLLLILNQRVPRIDRGSELLKVSNELIITILKNADITTSFVVLIKRLQRTLDVSRWPSPASAAILALRDHKFPYWVVKCLIKLTKDLRSRIDEVDVDRIRKLAMGTIRRRIQAGYGALDRPLQMLRTVLYELGQIQRTEHLSSRLYLSRSST